MEFGNKVLWLETKKKTSFGDVRLKHRELFFGSGAEKKSMETVEKAYLTVRSTIALIYNNDGAAQRQVDDAMQIYFKCNDKMKVLGTLELIQNGMKNGFALKTDVTSMNRFAYELRLPAVFAQKVQGYVRDKNVGDIHVKRSYIMNDQLQAVRILIHEASHKFAQTNDYGYKGYIKSDSLDFSVPGITAEECLTNADSYAYFCMKLGFS